ncbi:MAG: tetratricopeptide repeat protein [Myxococcaceae bacterium]|nr:MAG: tetratricopeptide repeat protein [Myxococcaceae bacterium]
MTTARRSSPSRAAVLTALLTFSGIPSAALAQTPPAAEAPSAAVAAQARFDRGRELFQQGRFADALPEFRASLELFRSPNTLLYVGLCLQRMERYAESSAALSRTVSEAGAMLATDRRYESARDLARRALAEIEPRVAQLSVQVINPPPGVTVHVGRTTLDAEALGVLLPYDPAEVTVLAEAPGFLPSHQSVRLTAGGRASIELALRAAPAAGPVTVTVRPPEPSPARRGGAVRVAGFVVGGLGVASLAAFAVLGSMASSQYDDLSRVCPRPFCTAARVREIDDGVQLTTMANVALGVGAAAVVAGVVMIAVGGPRVVSEGRAQAYVDPSLGTVGVRGAF